MASRRSRRQVHLVDSFESRTVGILTVAIYLAAIALFAGAALNPKNTLALVDPFIRRVRPNASFADIDRIHLMARELGHFLIPATAFAVLVFGPLRRRPLLALSLCALFAVIDESLQSFMPGRTGSLADVIVDASGATLAYLLYRAILRIHLNRQATAAVRS
jgi:VanZ family protein